MSDTNSKMRIAWVDYIKAFACVLVVVFHLLMSMNTSGFLKANAAYYAILQSVYTFHVPLFFVCSGYLYQKYSKVYTLKSYKNNIIKKFVALGVPYCTFTAITLLLKNVFSDSVNNHAENFFYTMFIDPVAPYWYLYVLFFMFLITPCFKSKNTVITVLLISLASKFIYTFLSDCISIPIIGKLMYFELFFLAGIWLSFVDIKKLIDNKNYILTSSLVSLICAIIISLRFYQKENSSLLIQSIISLLFVYSIIFTSIILFNKPANKRGKIISNLFMPIYVMHTIFAAGIRALLVHFGITNLPLHILLGLFVSFVLPTLYYLLATKIKPLMFFIYPTRCLTSFRKDNKNECH